MLCAAIATVLLCLAVVLLVSHIGLLTNATGLTNVVLVGIVPLTLIIGVVAAGVLKSRRPEVYAGIGGLHPEDGHLPPVERRRPPTSQHPRRPRRTAHEGRPDRAGRHRAHAG